MILYHLTCFILGVEGLSALISDRESRGLIYSCRVARGVPVLSHLFFADDSFFFFKAILEEVDAIVHCFNCYEKASG